MPLGDFVKPGTTPKPLVIGRLLLFGFGIFLVSSFIIFLIFRPELTGSDFPTSLSWIGDWIGVAFSWWYFSDLVVVGFGRSWARRPQVAALGLAAILLMIDLVAYSELWDLPLAWGVFLFTEFFFGFLGVSFLLAAVLAVPG